MARKQRSSISVYMPPIPKIEIRNTGNWVKVENGLTHLQPAIQHGYDIGVAKFSDKLIRIIRKAIHTHKPPAGSGVQWAPLKRNHDGGIKRNHDGGIYYLKGDYYKAVGVYKYRNRILVGMPSGTKHYSGLTLNQLAIILEYGNENIPARPLWRPSLKSAGGPKELRNILMKEIRRSIMTRTGLKANQIRGLW